MIIHGHHGLMLGRIAGGLGPEHDFGQTLYWPMQETSGTVMTEVMEGLNGTYTNGPTVNVTGPRSGYSGVRFDGTDDHSVIAHDALLNPGTDDYAVEFWAKLESEATLGVVWAKFAAGTSPTFPGVLIFSNFRNNGFNDPYWITHRTQNSGGYYQSFDIDAAPPGSGAPDAWYHYIFQRRLVSGTYYLMAYHNGILRTQFTLTGSTNITITDPLYIMGRPSSVQCALGNMALLRWYNGLSFTDAEAAAVYAARIS